MFHRACWSLFRILLADAGVASSGSKHDTATRFDTDYSRDSSKYSRPSFTCNQSRQANIDCPICTCGWTHDHSAYHGLA